MLCSESADVTEVRERSESWVATAAATPGLPVSGMHVWEGIGSVSISALVCECP